MLWGGQAKNVQLNAYDSILITQHFGVLLSDECLLNAKGLTK